MNLSEKEILEMTKRIISEEQTKRQNITENRLLMKESDILKLVKESVDEVLNTKNEVLSLEQLKNKYPNFIPTLEKREGGIYQGKYFVKGDIKTQGGKIENLGGLKGPVGYKEGLEFLNKMANNNYDKFY